MKTLLAFAAVLLAAPLSAKDITVVHTNDIHGWIMPREASWNKDNPKRMVGGAAALASFYRSVQGPKLLLDGGDWFQGTPEGTISRGEAAVDVFNALPYDAVVVGNHDFDMQEARLKELVGMLKMPVLGANVYVGKTGKRTDYLKPWIVKDVDGVKVGIFGLLTTNMKNLTFEENFAGLTFRDEIAEAKDAVAALKKLGATVIIMVDHVGYEAPEMAKYTGEQTIAASVPGIDLIVGGHSHTFVRRPTHDAKNGTLITQAGSYLSAAGKVTLTVDDKTGKVTASTGALVDLWLDAVGEDAQLNKVVTEHAKKVSAVYDVTIATTEAALTRNRDGEASMGDWMTDCGREWAGADVAIQNGGGIRADFDKGPLTLREVFNLMPFDNFMVKLDMKGSDVRELFDYGVNKNKGMIQMSGATFAYDRDAEPGRRVSDVTVGGKPLDDAATYKIVTIDFLVKGGDGYSAFSRALKTDRTRTLLRDVLAECARRERTIPPPQGGRMRPREKH